jgi:hypothetical protein
LTSTRHHVNRPEDSLWVQKTERQTLNFTGKSIKNKSMGVLGRNLNNRNNCGTRGDSKSKVDLPTYTKEENVNIGRLISPKIKKLTELKLSELLSKFKASKSFRKLDDRTKKTVFEKNKSKLKSTKSIQTKRQCT